VENGRKSAGDFFGSWLVSSGGGFAAEPVAKFPPAWPTVYNSIVVYDRNHAADLVGLSPITLTNYTRPGYSNLKRDVDYFVRSWQQGPYHRRRLFFTERGLRRLLLRAYRVYRPGSLSSSQQEFIDRMDATVRLPRKEDRPGGIPVSRHPLAINRRVRDEAAQAMREYLEHPVTAH
jgi:hypothetical protein